MGSLTRLLRFRIDSLIAHAIFVSLFLLPVSDYLSRGHFLNAIFPFAKICHTDIVTNSKYHMTNVFRSTTTVLRGKRLPHQESRAWSLTSQERVLFLVFSFLEEREGLKDGKDIDYERERKGENRQHGILGRSLTRHAF